MNRQNNDCQRSERMKVYSNDIKQIETSSSCCCSCSSSVGATGPMGPTGPTGPMGRPGASGATGPTGAAGADGAIGATGATGPAGADGAVGATGPAGADGAIGATGATGPAGADGAIGATGATGPAGADGAVGATGPAGADGAIGATGPAGADGAIGATGATGPAGTTARTVELATINSIPSGSYLGIGTVSLDYSTNTFVVPANTRITNITLQVRNNELSANETVTATAYVSPDGNTPTATLAVASLTAPSVWSTSAANVSVNAGSLISVRIIADSTLQRGAAVTLTFSN